MIETVKEWICFFFFRLLFPLVFLAACVVRIGGISMSYGLLALLSALVAVPTCQTIKGHTGAFLIFSIFFSALSLISQSAFQIWLAAGGTLENCSELERSLWHVGLQKIGSAQILDILRIILPDIATLFTSIAIYLFSRILLPHHPHGRATKPTANLIQVLSGTLVVVLLALCGVTNPSLVTAVYFLAFLLVASLWACTVPFGKWFVVTEALLLVYNFLHLVFFYTNQLPAFQNLWPTHTNLTASLVERLVGVPRVVVNNCSEPWYLEIQSNINAEELINIVVLILLFFALTYDMLSRISSTSTALSDTTNLNTMNHPNYQSLSSSNSRDHRPSIFEANKRLESVKSVLMMIVNYMLKQSYIAALIIMMAWSIAYHSWLSLVFLLAACLIWMVPQKRQWALRMSPVILFYAQVLLILNYIYSLHLTDLELPVTTPSGYPLSEIGLTKSPHAVAHLCVQCLFSIAFFVTLRHHVWESRQPGQYVEENTEVPYSKLSTRSFLRRTSIHSRDVFHQIGDYTKGVLIKYWMLMCCLLLLFISLQDCVVYRIVYMIFFFFFILSLQLSYGFWRAMVKVFWVIVIIYSIVILLSIYLTQFINVITTIHNTTGISYQVLRDIGIEKYNTKDLFVSLLTPTSFLIFVILLIHYFQTPFLELSNLDRYKNASVREPDAESAYGQSIMQQKTWRKVGEVVYVNYKRFVVLLWRCAEVHIHKLVCLIIFVVCALDVCLLNLILMVLLLVLMVVKFEKTLSLLAMMHCAVVIVVRMVYQLQAVDEKAFVRNCSVSWNVSGMDMNAAHYVGLHKDPDLFNQVYLQVILALLLSFEAIVKFHQIQYFRHPNHPTLPTFLIFKGICRDNADNDMKSCLMFLVNCGFYKFGKEICFMFTAILMVVRMDLYSIIYGLLMGILIFPFKRATIRKIWPCYVVVLMVLLLIQYVLSLGLPPFLCIEYPWNRDDLVDYFPYNLKVFLFLPDYINSPKADKLILDFLQLLLACLQMRVFKAEVEPDNIGQYGGTNDSIVPLVESSVPNPTHDFMLFRHSYLDYIKIGVFYYSFWLALLILFVTASTRVSLFSLGYLIGCFFFLWYGQDLLLKPIGRLNKIWSFMLFYCYCVIMCKSALQLVGCVYYQNLHCLLIRLFHITCIEAPDYEISFKEPTPDFQIDCNVLDEHSKLVWDVIAFMIIIILVRAYKSWYFQHVVRELAADNELSSKGSELINEMTYQRIESQRNFEATVLDKIRLKVDKIRKKMLSQTARLSQLDNVKSYTDHYEVIRSGDYSMFEETISQRQEDKVVVTRKDIKQIIRSAQKLHRPPTMGELLNAWSVSSTSHALFLWDNWISKHRSQEEDNNCNNNNNNDNNNGNNKENNNNETSSNNDENPNDNDRNEESDFEIEVSGDEEEEEEEEEEDVKEGGDDDDGEGRRKKKKKKKSAVKKYLRFLYVLLLAGCEQLIIFLHSLAFDYVLISQKLKEEKQKRREQSLKNKNRDVCISISNESSAQSNSLTNQTPDDLCKAELQFKSNLPLPLRMCNGFFIVFLNNSELLCYFAMTLVAIQYGSVFSIVYPITALLWGMLSCPRPSKTFWLFAIGYTETIIIVKYVFQFFDFVGPTDTSPHAVFYPPYVIGVAKDSHYALFYIILLFCLFFHRSVLTQHGLWKDVETSRNDLQMASNQQVPLKKEEDDDDDAIATTSINATISTKIDDEEDDDDDDIIRHSNDMKNNNLTNDDDDDCEKDKLHNVLDLAVCKPIVSFYKLLKDTSFKAATDVYVFIFLTDIICLIITIIGFSSFGPSDYSTSGVIISTVLKKNKIPPAFLGMLLAQFILMMIDRAIYLRKQVIMKFILQVLLVILIHAWTFFILPSITQRRFIDNVAAQLWYFTKCIYLALSSYQIKSGYPTCILGNFLTKKYSYLNLYCFRGFLIIPFLLELRALMDWMFTDTTLALTSWLQMEDIYANVFCIKCNRSAEKRYKTPRGNRKASYIKYTQGGIYLAILILVIWFPLLLFSMSNTIFQPNPPVEISVNIKLAGFEQLFTATSQQITPFTNDDYNYFYSNFPLATKTFLSSYQLSDIFNISLAGQSGGLWTISPPSMGEMVLALKERAVVTVQFSVSVRRNPTGSTELILGQFDRPLYKDVKDDESVRNKLVNLISGASKDSVDVVSVFPRYIICPANGKIQSAENYFSSQFSLPFLNEDLRGNLQLSLFSADYDNYTRWWSVQELTDSNKTSKNDVKTIRIVTFNERVAPAGVLSILNNYGIIGLYVSLVLVIGRFVRMYIQGLSYKIMFEELPDPDVLMTLCQDIYMVRESVEFRLEEELFAQLHFLYRSPETLLKVTKLKVE